MDTNLVHYPRATTGTPVRLTLGLIYIPTGNHREKQWREPWALLMWKFPFSSLLHSLGGKVPNYISPPLFFVSGFQKLYIFNR